MHQTVFMNKHKSTNDYCFSTFESSFHHNLWILKTPFICLWFFFLLFSMNRKSKFLAKLFVVCILISDRREHFCADGMGTEKKRIEINLTLFICLQLWNMFSISDKKTNKHWIDQDEMLFMTRKFKLSCKDNYYSLFSNALKLKLSLQILIA